jgi:lysophospholipase L1-like esterase
MPLGASITRGDPADPDDPDKNGYRKFLRDRLRFDGWEVNMVGSVSSWGNMNDRVSQTYSRFRRYSTSENWRSFQSQDNEGWPGYKVAGVREKASTSVPMYQPNLIAINAGTNDGQQDGPGQAPADMDGLIDDCFENSPGTVVLLSTLLPNGNAPQAIREINTGYRNIVSRRQG